MNTQDLSPQNRIDRYLLGQATEEDVAVLNELLSKDQQLRKHYRFRVAMEGGYREASVRTDAAMADDGASFKQAKPARAIGKNFFTGFVAATVSLAATVLLVVTMANRSGRETLGVGSTVSPLPVARLVTSVDANWRTIDPSPGASLGNGTFHLDSGIIELQFNRGARVTLRGPSHFELKNADLMHVSSGNLVARIPEEAIGFTITTDEAEVVDLGTEFGLRVEDGRQTEVHVIEGLVEVFQREQSNKRSAESVRIQQGQAIRWKMGDVAEIEAEKIPVQSSLDVLGTQQRSDLGLTFLQGNIRLKENVTSKDLRQPTSSWIEVIPEQRGVILEKDIPITLVTPGNHRVFGRSDLSIPAATKVDSYLFHFRSMEPAPVQGVIKFDREIIGLVCEADQLAISDSVVGRVGMRFPVASRQYRGLEPRVRFNSLNADKGGGWTADEVTISNDMRTLGLSVNVNPMLGVDQLRVLVRSGDDRD